MKEEKGNAKYEKYDRRTVPSMDLSTKETFSVPEDR